MSTYKINGSGFVDAVHDAQQIFRVLLSAFANPCTAQALAADNLPKPPAPLEASCAGVVLALCDYSTNLWLSEDLKTSEVCSYLQFYTSVKIVDELKQAQFALASSYERLPELEKFNQGDLKYPDSSTTIILSVAKATLTDSRSFKAIGPGIQEYQSLNGDYAQALGEDFAKFWSINQAAYPLGVDMFLVRENEVVGLPRTTKLTRI